MIEFYISYNHTFSVMQLIKGNSALTLRLSGAKKDLLFLPHSYYYMIKHFMLKQPGNSTTHCITSSKFAILPGWAIGHNTFDLQEFLLVVITAHNGEAEAPRGFDEAGADELPLQLCRIAGEHHTLVRAICRLGET